MRLRSLGDVVLLTPALAALHAWRPDLRLCLLVEPPYAAVVEGNPAVAEILLARDVISTALELRRRRFSVVFNQHAGPTSAFLTAASGAPWRVCWAGRQFSFVYNVSAPEPAGAHTVEHRLAQFHWTGLPRGPIPPAVVYPQPAAEAAIARKLSNGGIAPGEPYAVLRPGAAFFTKRWSFEHFAELARWLREARGIKPVVDIGPGDREIAAAVRRELACESAVLDSLDVRELIALVAGARLFVGNDTGPTHLAAAAGCPVVAIFGSSSSIYWRPWSAAHRVAQNDFPCNPCRGDRCYAFDEPRCILSVTVEQVREACEELLAKPDAATRDVVQRIENRN